MGDGDWLGGGWEVLVVGMGGLWVFDRATQEESPTLSPKNKGPTLFPKVKGKGEFCS